MDCRWVRFAYRILPLPAWRAFLLDRHIDRCPACRGAALDDAAIRSLGMTLAGLANEPPLAPFAAAASAPRRAFGFRLRYAYGVFLAGAMLWAVVAIWRAIPPAPGPQGTVTIAEADEEARVFTVGKSTVGGKPAKPVVFKVTITFALK